MKTSEKKAEYNKEYSKRTHYAAQSKYNRERCKAITIRLTPNDGDIIEWLEKQSNKQGAIKFLIRAYGIKKQDEQEQEQEQDKF